MPFDFAEIDRFVGLVEKFDCEWHDFFKRKKLKVLLLFYEDFVANYVETIRSICRYIGVSDDEISIRPHAYQQQADSLSSQWEQEYRRMKGAGAGPL